MTPLKRFLRRILERVLERWEEGPECPDRILDAVDEFQAYVPGALPTEWARFAKALAASAWRQGHARGSEVDAGLLVRYPQPDRVADLEHPSWRASPPVDLR